MALFAKLAYNSHKDLVNFYTQNILKHRPCSCHGKLGQYGETWSHGMMKL